MLSVISSNCEWLGPLFHNYNCKLFYLLLSANTTIHHKINQPKHTNVNTRSHNKHTITDYKTQLNKH